MHGTFETIDERPALSFERRLGHPVDEVWRAITEPAELAHWFPSAVEADLRVGGAMTFRFEQTLPDGSSTMSGEVTDLERPRLFAFYWGQDHLRFELEPIEDDRACLLRFRVELDARDKAARDAAGWHVCLDRLERRLGSPGEEPGREEWRAHYEEYGRRGFPTGAPVPL
jgi:uncharacterized protein YndB with AHSA1/START domain